MSKQDTLRSCLWRFIKTKESVLVFCWFATLIAMQWSVLSFIAMLFGIFLYARLEEYTHRQMHENANSLFHKSHQRHHDDPRPETGVPDLWLFAVFIVVTIVSIVFELRILMAVWLGVSTMLIAYEFAHFLCHCNYRPKTKFGWRIRTNHLKHHNYDDSKFYELLLPKDNNDCRNS